MAEAARSAKRRLSHEPGLFTLAGDNRVEPLGRGALIEPSIVHEGHLQPLVAKNQAEILDRVGIILKNQGACECPEQMNVHRHANGAMYLVLHGDRQPAFASPHVGAVPCRKEPVAAGMFQQGPKFSDVPIEKCTRLSSDRPFDQHFVLGALRHDSEVRDAAGARTLREQMLADPEPSKIFDPQRAMQDDLNCSRNTSEPRGLLFTEQMFHPRRSVQPSRFLVASRRSCSGR